jgi:hypothetical protein
VIPISHRDFCFRYHVHSVSVTRPAF